MKSITLALLVLPMMSFASNAPKMSYQCVPTAKVQLDAGPDSGLITKIKSLEISDVSDSSSYNMTLTVDGVSAVDAANGKTTPQESKELFKLKEAKSGTLLELSGADSNAYSFSAVFLEYGSVDVQTAGPLPEGTFKAKISMAFVDSNIFYKNPSPLMVKKVVFACNATVKY